MLALDTRRGAPASLPVRALRVCSTRSTYLVDDSTNSRGQTITRAEYDRVAAIQDAHIAKSHMVVVDGYIGSDPRFRTRARLVMEAANANVAGMQKQLYYPAGDGYDPAG